ncbi:MAG TPA: hypothetical protein PK348_04100, partial [Spirochaetota bacterium]|nr:hypothetical protein [Spirochaetota bacterium]
ILQNILVKGKNTIDRTLPFLTGTTERANQIIIDILQVRFYYQYNYYGIFFPFGFKYKTVCHI